VAGKPFFRPLEQCISGETFVGLYPSIVSLRSSVRAPEDAVVLDLVVVVVVLPFYRV